MGVPLNNLFQGFSIVNDPFGGYHHLWNPPPVIMVMIDYASSLNWNCTPGEAAWRPGVHFVKQRPLYIDLAPP